MDLSGPAMQPLYHPISQIVYAGTGSEVTHCWVGGEPLMTERRLATLDLPAIIGDARRWRDVLSET